MSAAATKSRSTRAGTTGAKKPSAKESTAAKSPAKKSSGRKSPARKAPSKPSAAQRSAASRRIFLIDVAALRSRNRRRRLVLLSITLLVGTFFGVALVQAQLVQTQKDVDRLQIEINRLDNDLALLDRRVVEASSPEVIVERARNELGMVNALNPQYLVATRPLER